MKFKCPQCGQNFKASPDPPLINGMYDLCCPPHSRIRFDKDHNLIEYNLYTDTYGLAATTENYCYAAHMLEKEETVLYKLTDERPWPKVITLNFFLDFKTQKELDSLIPRLLNLKAFS